MLSPPRPAATYTVQGVPVDVPMTVERATAGLSVHAGPADVVDAALPEDLEPVRLPGGRAPVLLLCVRYVDTPLGAYDEVVVGLGARPRGGSGVVGVADVLRGRAGVWIDRMAVDQPFTRDAGEQIWGYPKTLDEIEIDEGPRTWTTTWGRDGRRIAEVRMPRGRVGVPVPPVRLRTFTQVEGRTLATTLTAHGRGVRVRPGGVTVAPGDHPDGAHLRALGVAGRALASAWLGTTRMHFSPARTLDVT